MRLWRIVLEAGKDVWTFLVASKDPFVAVDLARGSLPDGRGDDASLEELEAIYDTPPARAGVIEVWSGAPVIPLRMATAGRKTLTLKAKKPKKPAKKRKTA